MTLSCELTPAQMLRISVVDNGIGIPLEHQGALFSPFERLGHELGQIDGSGIGLSITKQIVEMLGGQIGFESEHEKGSTFWVDIGLSDQQSVDPSEINVSEITEMNDSERKRTVLYIEDNEDSVHLVKAIVAQIGNIKLLTAENATIGYDISTSKKPDLILMDINLPGMNGLQALKRLQRTIETRDIPVIAVTSNTQVKDIEEGLKAGFKAYITKPIQVTEFIHTIDETLNRTGLN